MRAGRVTPKIERKLYCLSRIDDKKCDCYAWNDIEIDTNAEVFIVILYKFRRAIYKFWAQGSILTVRKIRSI